MEVFQNYAYYYNAFYKDKNYETEAQVIDTLLKKYSDEQAKKIINFGCGTGMHDTHLARLGYQCTGVDVSSAMVELAKDNAKKNGLEIDYQVADIRTYEAKQKYDAVISLFHVICYQNRNENVLDTFKSARSILNPGSIFIFDVWYGPGVLSDKPCIRVKEVDEKEKKLIRIARPVMNEKENLVNVDYEVLVIDKSSNETKTIRELHNMRYFFRPELEMLLSMTGFSLIDNVDCETLKETNFNSWTSYFIARAV